MQKNYWQAEHVRLRALEDKDLQMYLDERNPPDSMREWYEDRILTPSSETELKEEFAKTRDEFNRDDKKIFIIETNSMEYAGEISVWHTDKRNRYFRYGIFLKEEYRGKGYAKEALVIVLDYYFNELGFNKCSPTVYEYNKNSQKFHERFGFVLEGKLRGEVYTRGKYYDMYYYGMSNAEFNSLYKHFI